MSSLVDFVYRLWYTGLVNGLSDYIKVRVTPEMKVELKAIARRLGLSVSGVVRMAVVQFLERNKETEDEER